MAEDVGPILSPPGDLPVCSLPTDRQLAVDWTFPGHAQLRTRCGGDRYPPHHADKQPTADFRALVRDGLTNFKQQTEHLNGDMNINSAPNKGGIDRDLNRLVMSASGGNIQQAAAR
ncbi:hypothetical protein [Mycolicibacterium moriokaense]|uniref:Uncharacterized protein n=1 Tax=Mycolicibacterium moriokaense TaxID=39691 RepID=A0A318HG70_9MYCO|nr:hypothetical protein [Mycolicibacterium moriokaense]PXX08341.1 hypothetical protein C8E89_1085 [Mycolicibacterium moriokaense]